jgi:hypothetical protein
MSRPLAPRAKGFVVGMELSRPGWEPMYDAGFELRSVISTVFMSILVAELAS